MRLPIRRAWLALGTATILISASTAQGESAASEAPRKADSGPQDDFPVLIGDPYVVAGTSYTPLDAMNYDEVGYAGADAAAADGVSAAHHTLPVPSYVEVTALSSGRTILVRIERRGPMDSDRLVALSRDAMAQLALGEGGAVRVRRVNPPEDERAALRAGQAAAPRMMTPPGLLRVLARRLPATGSASVADPRQTMVSGRAPSAAILAGLAAPLVAARPAKDAQPVPQGPAQSPIPQTTPPTRQAAHAKADAVRFRIQLGTFADRSNADRLAARTGGQVVAQGRFAVVTVGPFTSRGQAMDALAKLRGQGYSDASIRSYR